MSTTPVMNQDAPPQAAKTAVSGAAHGSGNPGLEPRVCPREAGSGRSGRSLYRTIVADPPWHYDDFCQIHSKAGRTVKPLPYGSMTVKEICALPVNEIAAPDCRLFLWTTNRYLPDSFGVMAAWGFDYKQTLVWHKVGNPSPWGGSVAPNHAEFLLVGVRGKPERKAMMKSSVVGVNVQRHSAKPDVFLDHVESVSEGPYVELFARSQRLGWHTWGNQSICHTSLGGGGAELAGDEAATQHSGAGSQNPAGASHGPRKIALARGAGMR